MVSTTAARVVDKLYLQYCGTSDDGLHLEMVQADADGNHTYAEPYPLASICTNRTGEFYLHLHTDFGQVKVRLAEVERAIAIAREEIVRGWAE